MAFGFCANICANPQLKQAIYAGVLAQLRTMPTIISTAFWGGTDKQNRIGGYEVTDGTEIGGISKNGY